VTDVLADFQRWYEQALAGNGILLPPPPVSVDLATLLGHFVALRQEVNLQTRSVRAQQEQTADFFRRLEEGIAALSRAARRQEPADDRETLRPLLKALVDLYDALSMAGQQIERVQAAVLPLLDDLVVPTPSERPSFWSRWFGSPSSDNAQRGRQERAREAVDRIRQVIEGLVTGYTMSVERIDQALRQHGLEPMPAVGDPFDPEQMEVLEAVNDTGRPSGTVLEVVRRGYRHQGRVFRYAQVRVARS
jgi:molecular chaperone GrpE